MGSRGLPAAGRRADLGPGGPPCHGPAPLGPTPPGSHTAWGPAPLGPTLLGPRRGGPPRRGNVWETHIKNKLIFISFTPQNHRVNPPGNTLNSRNTHKTNCFLTFCSTNGSWFRARAGGQIQPCFLDHNFSIYYRAAFLFSMNNSCAARVRHLLSPATIYIYNHFYNCM